MTGAYHVLLAGGAAAARRELALALGARNDLRVVGETGRLRDAAGLAESLVPDVVVLDASRLPRRGIEVARRILCDAPQTRVVVLVSPSAEERTCFELHGAGANACVVSSATPARLVAAIRRAGAHKQDPSSLPGRSRSAPTGELSRREIQVLKMIADGLQRREIAEALRVSVKTVETHRANIAVKLGIRTVAGLTKYAVRVGLTPLEG